MKKRIGIYTGTFDPVHVGHLGFAVRALDAAKLDEVVFIPEKRPREKDRVTDLQHRFELLVRAIEPYEGLLVRLLEPEQFCVRGTMPALRDMFGDAELCMLLGSDVVKTFPERWANLDDLFENMELVIGLRKGDTRKGLKKMLKSLDVHIKPRYTFVDSPIAAASSTRIRRGHVVRDMPPEVSTYVQKHHLYRTGKEG
jgi:nicotinate-nucleotide adenylyltransferase